MDDYIAKPFQIDQLQEAIARVLAKRQQPRSATGKTVTAGTASATALSGSASGGGGSGSVGGSGASEELDSVPVLDQAMIESFRALDDTGAAWQELVSIFATSMERRTSSLHALHTRLLEGFRELGTVSHSFKVRMRSLFVRSEPCLMLSRMCRVPRAVLVRCDWRACCSRSRPRCSGMRCPATRHSRCWTARWPWHAPHWASIADDNRAGRAQHNIY